MKRVGFGFLGTTLDAVGGFGQKRHGSWRPTVSFGLDATLKLSRIELWYGEKHLRLAQTVKGDIEQSSPTTSVNLREVQLSDPWNFEEVYGFLFDFADQYEFRPEEEEYFVHLTTGTHVAQICLFLLTETRHFPGKLVQTHPRQSSGEKEPSISIIDLDLSQYDQLSQRFERKLVSDLEILKTGIKTRNVKFNTLISEIEQVARASREPILLLGPTGAGKSQLAKQIFLLKKSHHKVMGPFIDINCATLRGDQAMSTLFGHSKGAFTGAAKDREGLLRKADGGVLFLDEIGELGLDEQAMLLRALETGRFFPLGKDEEEQSDFELIAGTNRKLFEVVRTGSFREDLLRRIDTWSFVLPGLADRREDIEPNLEFELGKFEERSGRRITFSSEAKTAYLKFANSSEALWSGNFRDLNSSVIRMSTLAPQGRITADCVSKEIARLKCQWSSENLDEQSAGALDSLNINELLKTAGVTSENIDLFDRAQLAQVIATMQTVSTIAEAGRALFQISRKGRTQVNDSDRIRKYLGRFGVDAKRLLRGS